MENQTVLILDFGGQYKELIARRVRECGVYSMIKPYDISLEEIKKINPIGIIFTGGPNSVYLENAPKCDEKLYSLGIPVLGICYGSQLITHMLGGEVSSCKKSEYGTLSMTVDKKSTLFDGLDRTQKVLMSHTDMISRLPEGFEVTAYTKLCPCAAYQCDKRNVQKIL